MPLGNWNLSWTNHNSQRAYPLTAGATKQDTTGSITLPNSFILALYLPIHSGLDVEPDKFFLRQLAIFPTGYNIAFAYDDGTDDPPFVASVNIARSTHSENNTYAIAGVNDFDDTVGHICIGKLDEIDDLPTGQYLFTAAGGQLEPDCVRPLIRGISSISIRNGADTSERLYGDITLSAGERIRFTVISEEGADPEIRIDAIDGEGLNEDCACIEELGDPIRTLNGVGPDESGNIDLLGTECVTLLPVTHGLQIADTCSAPCCGCLELEAILQQLDRMGDGKVTLEGTVNRLSAEVSTTLLTVLGSRLGDQACT